MLASWNACKKSTLNVFRVANRRGFLMAVVLASVVVVVLAVAVVRGGQGTPTRSVPVRWLLRVAAPLQPERRGNAHSGSTRHEPKWAQIGPRRKTCGGRGCSSSSGQNDLMLLAGRQAGRLAGLQQNLEHISRSTTVLASHANLSDLSEVQTTSKFSERSQSRRRREQQSG